jgi:hypothetical protein
MNVSLLMQIRQSELPLVSLTVAIDQEAKCVNTASLEQGAELFRRVTTIESGVFLL